MLFYCAQEVVSGFISILSAPCEVLLLQVLWVRNKNIDVGFCWLDRYDDEATCLNNMYDLLIIENETFCDLLVS